MRADLRTTESKESGEVTSCFDSLDSAVRVEVEAA